MALDVVDNFACLYQHEVQSARWYHERVNIHPVYTYYKCPNCEECLTQSIVSVSDDNRHDHHAVLTFVNHTMYNLRQVRNLQFILILCHSPNLKLFYIVPLTNKDRDVSLAWERPHDWSESRRRTFYQLEFCPLKMLSLTQSVCNHHNNSVMNTPALHAQTIFKMFLPTTYTIMWHQWATVKEERVIRNKTVTIQRTPKTSIDGTAEQLCESFKQQSYVGIWWFSSNKLKEFARKYHSMREVDRWKAKEFRTFLLYSGIASLKEVLSDAMYMFWVGFIIVAHIHCVSSL